MMLAKKGDDARKNDASIIAFKHFREQESPMSYTFKPIQLDDISNLVDDYIQTLSSPIESFLEYHILNSQLYVISSPLSETVGYFGIYKEKLLTQFYLCASDLKEGQTIFSEILSHYAVETAFIPTCDELFLSYALDQETTFSKQAYFFQDNKESGMKIEGYQDAEFRRATLADVADIRQISGDYFDELEESVTRDELFVLRDGDILLGIGVSEMGRILKGYSSVGMFVNEQFRRRGIGRNIILRLKEWSYAQGQIPVAGCNYYNINSKKTLESAGMITKTRLLKVEFSVNSNSGE
ncbi:MAG: GNAT family N-acetyltransferase [Chloroflexota bacterium]